MNSIYESEFYPGDLILWSTGKIFIVLSREFKPNQKCYVYSVLTPTSVIEDVSYEKFKFVQSNNNLFEVKRYKPS